MNPSLDSNGEEPSFWAAAALTIRNLRLGVIVALIVVAVGVPLVFLVAGRQSFTSRASFLPQTDGPQRMSAIAGLAAQYGISMGGEDNAESPHFYASLLKSRQLLGRAAEASYLVESDGGAVRRTLVQLYGARHDSARLAKEAAIKKLLDDSRVGVDRETGVVEIAVSAPRPDLARQIAVQLLDEVQDYNLSRRQSTAAAERRFVESRLAEERGELRRSEESLEQFLRRNRQFEKSPELQFAYDRLLREVTMRQQVVAALTQSYEEARIAEVRNTPVISIIEEPEVAIRPDPKGRVRNSILVVILAVGLGTLAAYIAGQIQHGRERDSNYQDFQAALEKTGMFGWILARRRDPSLRN